MPPAARLTVPIMIGQKAKDHVDKTQAQLAGIRGRSVTQSEVIEAYQDLWDRHPELRAASGWHGAQA